MFGTLRLTQAQRLVHTRLFNMRGTGVLVRRWWRTECGNPRRVSMVALARRETFQ